MRTYRNGEEAVGRLGNARQSIPPSDKRSNQTKDTGSLLNGKIDSTVNGVKVRDRKEQKGQIEEEE